MVGVTGVNILYTNFHLDKGGGHTTYVLALLQNQMHNKYVACPPSSLLYETLQKQGYDKLIPMYFPSRIVGEFGKTVAATKKFRDIIEKYDIDIVHNNGSADSRITLYSSWIAKNQFKVVYTKHNSYPIKNFISHMRFNKNDAVIFVSPSIFDTIGVRSFKTKVEVIENGIDTRYWSTDKTPETGRALTLISNAGTADSKGWRFITQAVGGLDATERARIKIVLLGEKVSEENMRQAKDLCNIEFPGFFTDTRPWLEQADIGFVLSYKRETISFACREMMSMGLPQIVSNYGGLPYNIDDRTGWLTEPQNAESIRDALRLILSMTPDELAQMKQAAREKAVKDFSLDKMLAATNQVYDFVCGKKG